MPEADDSGREKRRRILEAAFAVCEERGVHAARMEEVAARAQVSKGTLYRFFDSKEDLVLATIIDSYAHAAERTGAGEAAEPVPPDEGSLPDTGAAELLRGRLDGLARALGGVARRARVFYQAWGVVGDSPRARARLEEFLTRFHGDRDAEYADWIRAGQREGVFRSDVDARVVALSIGALLSGFIYRSTFDPANATPEALRSCFDALLRNVLGYTDARPTGDPRST